MVHGCRPASGKVYKCRELLDQRHFIANEVVPIRHQYRVDMNLGEMAENRHGKFELASYTCIRSHALVSDHRLGSWKLTLALFISEVSSVQTAGASRWTSSSLVGTGLGRIALLLKAQLGPEHQC